MSSDQQDQKTDQQEPKKKRSSSFTPQEPDKRKFSRVEVHMKVELRTTYVYASASVLNLSTGGVFIKTGKPLPVGSELDLAMHFPNLETPIQISGVVRWVRSGAELDQSGMGVELMNITPEVRVAIDECLRQGPKNF
ncbi:MAG: hypothetical protein GMKNLPBB_01071 [Myxococcota bacterium]|nr:hypothetical protein [Myxococcota bacterium]